MPQTAESSNISIGDLVANGTATEEDEIQSLYHNEINIHTLNASSIFLDGSGISEVDINTVNESSIEHGKQKESIEVEDKTKSL